jgi:hypothetical protein
METESSGHKRKTPADPAVDTPQAIEAHLRADRILPPKTINALSEMIRLAYQAASEGKLGSHKKN